MATNSLDEHLNNDNDEQAHIDLLKSRVKHLFILSENGKPVFTRLIFNINHHFIINVLNF